MEIDSNNQIVERHTRGSAAELHNDSKRIITRTFTLYLLPFIVIFQTTALNTVTTKGRKIDDRDIYTISLNIRNYEHYTVNNTARKKSHTYNNYTSAVKTLVQSICYHVPTKVQLTKLN